MTLAFRYYPPYIMQQWLSILTLYFPDNLHILLFNVSALIELNGIKNILQIFIFMFFSWSLKYFNNFKYIFINYFLLWNWNILVFKLFLNRTVVWFTSVCASSLDRHYDLHLWRDVLDIIKGTKFVGNWRQIACILHVLPFPTPIQLKYCLEWR